MNASITALVGGTSVGADIRALANGTQVVVGVPGRVLDMLNRGSFKTDKLKLLVLDDGEQLLARGTIDTVYDIFKTCPTNLQCIVACVCLPDEILQITQKFMNDPEKILVKNEDLMLESIRYFVVEVEREEWKFDTLIDLFSSFNITQTIIFCNTSRKVDWLTQKLQEKNFKVSSFHSNIMQDERTAILQEFRCGSSRVLLSTDVLSHGIDVTQVSVVVNYDAPTTREGFVHRAGRTGRFGRKGMCITFATVDDATSIKEIERVWSISLAQLPANIEEYI